jgi:predicted transcriptional regulator
MEQVKIEDTHRVISGEALVEDKVQPKSHKMKIIIVFAAFLLIGGIVGLICGLYFHFQPYSVHIQTTPAIENDGTAFLSTKFQYVDNNINGDNVNQIFTIMFQSLNANTNSGQRLLQQADGVPNVDVTLHYTHESGIKMKFRDGLVTDVLIPIDQVVDYVAQKYHPQEYSARLLQQTQPQYPNANQAILMSDVYTMYKQEIQNSLQGILPQLQGNTLTSDDEVIY